MQSFKRNENHVLTTTWLGLMPNNSLYFSSISDRLFCVYVTTRVASPEMSAVSLMILVVFPDPAAAITALLHDGILNVPWY